MHLLSIYIHVITVYLFLINIKYLRIDVVYITIYIYIPIYTYDRWLSPPSPSILVGVHTHMMNIYYSVKSSLLYSYF